ncbi:MAG: hypothetical protein HGA98_05690, partial [Deltaproteobacteria bacterium]|nr:hypothetical protein [Deltaproteobacteria bacterium]
MKRLTLVRHAKSSRKDPSLPDFYRPLSGRGWDEAPEMGRRLAAAGVKPDAFVSSPANRAWSTSQEIASALGFPAEALRVEASIYDAEAGALLRLVRALEPAWEHVLLVGHNPGLTDLAQLL